MILDGNMKNNQEVCLAVDAGYAEFSGLPGRVQTGCPNSPGLMSRYCPLNAPVAAIPHETPNEERPAGIIVDKRVTRNSTLSQVTCTASYLASQTSWFNRMIPTC